LLWEIGLAKGLRSGILGEQAVNERSLLTFGVSAETGSGSA
jgi:hypothetical protein